MQALEGMVSAGSLVLNAVWVGFEWDELGKFYRLL